MKKQTKVKRAPPRRKPIRKPKMQRALQGDGVTPEILDRNEAHERAMRERMPPAVLEDYLRLEPINDDNMLPADGVTGAKPRVGLRFRRADRDSV